MSIDIQLDQWPVCFLEINGAMSLEDFERYIGTFNSLYDKKERFSVVTYLKRYSANTEFIARIGRWFKETEPLIKLYWVSNAMVSPSAGFRFLLSAVYLIKPLPTKSHVCSNPEEALAFTRTQWNDTRRLPPLRWPFVPPK